MARSWTTNRKSVGKIGCPTRSRTHSHRTAGAAGIHSAADATWANRQCASKTWAKQGVKVICDPAFGSRPSSDTEKHMNNVKFSAVVVPIGTKVPICSLFSTEPQPSSATSTQ